jgi:hypothetical protein
MTMMADADFAYSSPILNGPLPGVSRVRSDVAECLESRSLAFVLRRLMTLAAFFWDRRDAGESEKRIAVSGAAYYVVDAGRHSLRRTNRQ